MMFFRVPKSVVEPIVETNQLHIQDEQTRLWWAAKEAIRCWPRSWWRAMFAKAGLLPLRRKKDPCAQVNLHGNHCQRRHKHAGPCRFGVWVGGLRTAMEVDPRDPLDGAFIRRKGDTE